MPISLNDSHDSHIHSIIESKGALLEIIAFTIGILVLLFRIALTICPPLCRDGNKFDLPPDRRLKTGEIFENELKTEMKSADVYLDMHMRS